MIRNVAYKIGQEKKKKTTLEKITNLCPKTPLEMNSTMKRIYNEEKLMGKKQGKEKYDASWKGTMQN